MPRIPSGRAASCAQCTLRRRTHWRELPRRRLRRPGHGPIGRGGQRVGWCHRHSLPVVRLHGCRALHIRSGGRHSQGDCAGATGTRGDRGLTKPSIGRRSAGHCGWCPGPVTPRRRDARPLPRVTPRPAGGDDPLEMAARRQGPTPRPQDAPHHLGRHPPRVPAQEQLGERIHVVVVRPHGKRRHLLDEIVDPRPRREAAPVRAGPTHDVGPHKQCISGLNHAAYGLPVNASRPGSPQAHASLGSGWRPTLAGWDWIPTGFRTRFQRSHHGILSPLTGLSRHTRCCMNRN